MSMHVKKGDKVIILAGKDKGKSGRVLKVFTKTDKVIVEGANLVKKHVRRKSEAEAGGIREVPAPLHCSNVALFCSQCNKGTRAAVNVMSDKSKVRVCKKCQKEL